MHSLHSLQERGWPRHPLSCSLSSTYWAAQQEWRLEEWESQGHVLLENPQPGKRKMRFASPLTAHSLIPAQDLAGMSASSYWLTDVTMFPPVQALFPHPWCGILWGIGDWEVREYQGTITASGAKAEELCCSSKAIWFFPDGAFVLAGCHWALLQLLTDLLQACECHLSAGLNQSCWNVGS